MRLSCHPRPRASAKDKCSAVVADPLKLNGSSEHTMPAYSGKLVPTSAVQNEFAPTRYYHRVAYGEWGDFGSPADGMISMPVPVSTSGKCPRTVLVGTGTKRMRL